MGLTSRLRRLLSAAMMTSAKFSGQILHDTRAVDQSSMSLPAPHRRHRGLDDPPDRRPPPPPTLRLPGRHGRPQSVGTATRPRPSGSAGMPRNVLPGRGLEYAKAARRLSPPGAARPSEPAVTPPGCPRLTGTTNRIKLRQARVDSSSVREERASSIAALKLVRRQPSDVDAASVDLEVAVLYTPMYAAQDHRVVTDCTNLL